MKKIFLIIILLICGASHVNDYVLLKTLTATVTFMTTDNLGNLYLVVNNELRKFDSGGTLLKTYSDKSHGNLFYIDVADPLKILLHYRDFHQVLFLDNMLSLKMDPILLDDLALLQPLLVCNSYDNGFWVYDQQDFQLLRFDKNLKNSNQSGNIVQLTRMEIKPNFLTEVGNMVYLNDPDNGILVFDKYGTYSQTIPIKNLSSFQLFDDNIIYSSKSELFRYNLKTFEQQTMNLPVKEVKNVRYEKDRIYVQDSISVKIFSTK